MHLISRNEGEGMGDRLKVKLFERSTDSYPICGLEGTVFLPVAGATFEEWEGGTSEE